MTREHKGRSAAVQLAALTCAVIICFPVLYGLLGAFQTPAEFASANAGLLPRSFLNFDNYAQALHRMPYARYLLNSLVTSALGSFIRLLFALLAAFAFSFYQFRGKNVLFALLLCTMLLPMDTLMTTNYLTVSRLGLLDSYLGVIVPYLVGASAMFMLRQAFSGLPRGLREAALMDGCGDMRFMAAVLLPLKWPVIATLFVQGFFNIWNAYLWPLLVTNQPSMRTLQVGIAMLTSGEDVNHTVVLAGAMLTLPPSLIIFARLRRRMTAVRVDGALVE